MIFAIIGYGKMGKFYDSLLQARYVVDVVPLKGRIYFSNVDEFIAYQQPVDLVIVSSITRAHYQITKKLLLANYNVLVEKPVCIAASEAEELEAIAQERRLVLYQSTLERYNPLVKFLRKNVAPESISHIESFRFGKQPATALIDDAKFDLAIHDIDLWFHLYNREVPWKVHAGYADPRREIIVFLKDGGTVQLDLLHKFISVGGHTMDFSKSSPNNPILEMIFDLTYRGRSMNERWSREIRILEQAHTGVIDLS